MKFDHPKHDASFEIDDPEEWTTRQILNYDSVLEMNIAQPFYVRLWKSAKVLIHDWDCDFIDVNDELDDAKGIKAAEVLKWASLAVFSARRSLDGDEKN